MIRKIDRRMAAVFAIALLLRLAAALAVSAPLDRGDTLRYESLAADGGFGVVQAPLYPLFLRGVYAVFGGQNHRAVFILQGALGSLVPVLIYSFAARLRSKRAALMAGLFAAVYPNFIIYGCTVLPDVFLVLLTAAFLAIQAAGARDTLRSATQGTLIGLGILIRPWFAFFAPGALAVTKRRILFIGVLALALAPWAARNANVSGKIVPVYAPASYNIDAARYETSRDGWELLDRLYENALPLVIWYPAYSSAANDAAVERGPITSLRRYSYIFVWILGGIGLARRFRRRDLELILPFLVFWLLLTALTHPGDARYRSVLEPLVIAYAAILFRE